MAWISDQVAKGRGLWFSLAVMLVLALPGFFTLPPVDRDEVLFAQSARQMLASGDFDDIHFGDAVRHKKPVGIYWLQSAAAAITGQPGEIWTYRLVSLVAAMLAVGLTHATARLFLTPGATLLAAVALAASLMLGAEAHLAKTDAALLATVTAAQYGLARAITQGKLPVRLAMGFWAALAASILIKGPIGPAVVAFTLAFQCLIRRDLSLLRALRPRPGVALMLLIAAPWFIAITIRSHGGFWAASLGRDMFDKLAGGQESHGLPPGSYLAAVWLTFWPAAMPLAAALPAIWRGKREAVVGFAFCWLIPTWTVFEATPTKLLHYTLPTYPALALLLGYAWQTKTACAPSSAPLSAPLSTLWPATLPGLLPPVLLAAVVWQSGQIGLILPPQFWLGAASVIAATALILRTARSTSALPLAAALAAGGLALNATLYPTLAAMPQLWPAGPLAAYANAHPECDFTVAGYAEPSLVFLTNNHVHFQEVAALPATLASPGCHLIATPAPANFAGLHMVGEVVGLNLGTGHMVDLVVLLKP